MKIYKCVYNAKDNSWSMLSYTLILDTESRYYVQEESGPDLRCDRFGRHWVPKFEFSIRADIAIKHAKCVGRGTLNIGIGQLEKAKSFVDRAQRELAALDAYYEDWLQSAK